MKYRAFRDTKISEIGLGTWPIAGGMGQVDERTAIDTIHAAIDNGINLIDTADGYNDSENIIGKAIQESGSREKYFLATKVGDNYTQQGITQAVENSLRRMKTDYIDLFQLHHWIPSFPIYTSIKALINLKTSGKIKYIGITNFNADQLRIATAVDNIDSAQLVYNMFKREIETTIIPVCIEKGIHVIGHSCLAKGLLSGKYNTQSTFLRGDERESNSYWSGLYFGDNMLGLLPTIDKLKQTASELNCTVSQLAIAWCLKNTNITSCLVGCKTRQQVENICAACDMTNNNG